MSETSCAELSRKIAPFVPEHTLPSKTKLKSKAIALVGFDIFKSFALSIFGATRYLAYYFLKFLLSPTLSAIHIAKGFSERSHGPGNAFTRRHFFFLEEWQVGVTVLSVIFSVCLVPTLFLEVSMLAAIAFFIPTIGVLLGGVAWFFGTEAKKELIEKYQEKLKALDK